VTELTAREVLTTTRAVRRRLDLGRPVPRAVVDGCVEVAAQAPAGQNRSLLRWLLIDDPARRGRAAAVYRQVLADTLPTRIVRDEHDRRMYESVDHLGAIIDRVPVLALPYAKAPPPTAPPAHALTYWTSTVPAIWSFQLALRAEGLGSTLTTVHLGRAGEMADAVGMPPSFTQLGLLPIAYTIGTDFRPARRPGIEKLRRWNEIG
jgi:nitroreductase